MSEKKPLKNYLLFIFGSYADGYGPDDLFDSFDSVEDARRSLDEIRDAYVLLRDNGSPATDLILADIISVCDGSVLTFGFRVEGYVPPFNAVWEEQPTQRAELSSRNSVKKMLSAARELIKKSSADEKFNA